MRGAIVWLHTWLHLTYLLNEMNMVCLFFYLFMMLMRSQIRQQEITESIQSQSYKTLCVCVCDSFHPDIVLIG